MTHVKRNLQLALHGVMQIVLLHSIGMQIYYTCHTVVLSICFLHI